jgi:hypothetical protein
LRPYGVTVSFVTTLMSGSESHTGLEHISTALYDDDPRRWSMTELVMLYGWILSSSSSTRVNPISAVCG